MIIAALTRFRAVYKREKKMVKLIVLKLFLTKVALGEAPKPANMCTRTEMEGKTEGKKLTSSTNKNSDLNLSIF